jgi:hypothetical protein
MQDSRDDENAGSVGIDDASRAVCENLAGSVGIARTDKASSRGLMEHDRQLPSRGQGGRIQDGRSDDAQAGYVGNARTDDASSCGNMSDDSPRASGGRRGHDSSMLGQDPASQGPNHGSSDPNVRPGAAVRMGFDARTRAMCRVRTGLPTYTGYVMAVKHGQCQCWFHEDHSRVWVSVSLVSECLVQPPLSSAVVTPACTRTEQLVAGSHKLWGPGMPPCIGDIEDSTRRGAEFILIDVKRTQSGGVAGATVSFDFNAAAHVSFHAGNDRTGKQGLACCSLCDSGLERAVVQMQPVRAAASSPTTCPHVLALRHLYREDHACPDMTDDAVDHVLASTSARHSRGATPGALHVLPTSSEVHFTLCQVTSVPCNRSIACQRHAMRTDIATCIACQHTHTWLPDPAAAC